MILKTCKDCANRDEADVKRLHPKFNVYGARCRTFDYYVPDKGPACLKFDPKKIY